MASRQEVLRSIRAEWLEETGEDPGASGASVLLDQMCEAFFQISQGVGLLEAARRDRRTAEYLKWQWTGDEGRALREMLDLLDEDPDAGRKYWNGSAWVAVEER